MKSRKNGFFTTTAMIQEGGVVMQQEVDNFLNSIDSIFEDNIKLILNTPKIIHYQEVQEYILKLFDSKVVTQQGIPDIQQTIKASDFFTQRVEKIHDKISSDFNGCFQIVDQHYSNCKKVEQMRLSFRV